MSADLLRRAAELMRERAEAATPGPWRSHTIGDGNQTGTLGITTPDGSRLCWPPLNDSQHIASWSPAVALAVADWLYWQAKLAEANAVLAEFPDPAHARAVARAYLGETS